jgi:hypothetical protein
MASPVKRERFCFPRPILAETGRIWENKLIPTSFEKQPQDFHRWKIEGGQPGGPDALCPGKGVVLKGFQLDLHLAD